MTHRNVPRSYQMLKYNKNTRGIKMCYEMWNWKETIKKYHSKRPSTVSHGLWCTHLTNTKKIQYKSCLAICLVLLYIIDLS